MNILRYQSLRAALFASLASVAVLSVASCGRTDEVAPDTSDVDVVSSADAADGAEGIESTDGEGAADLELGDEVSLLDSVPLSIMAAEPPEVRLGHSAVWDPAGRMMIVFGGRKQGNERYNDVHLLHSVSDRYVWEQVYPTGTAPQARYGHSAVWDPVHQEMIVFGGYAAGPTNTHHILSRDGGDWHWSALVGGGDVPSARTGHSAVWDPVQQEMIVFGGLYIQQYFNTVYVLSREQDGWSWTEIQPEGQAPIGRTNHSAVWDSQGEQMIVYGGDGGQGATRLNDAHVLSRTAEGWRWDQLPEHPDEPSGSTGHSAVWNSSTSQMLLYDGGGFGNEGGSYILDRTGESWSWLNLSPAG